MSAPNKINSRAPRDGTAAYAALQALHGLGGQANDRDWRQLTQRRIRCQIGQWDTYVQALINTGLVFQRNGLFIVSDDGLSWLNVAAPDVVPRADPEDIPRRYVPPQRPLSSRHMPRMDMVREGSLDFLKIPSRIGDDLIPHRKA